MSNVMEEMEKELAIISETARQITHKRFGVDLTRKQLHRISKALSRYQSSDWVAVRKDRLDALSHALEILKKDYMGRQREAGSDCAVAIVEDAINDLTTTEEVEDE